MEKESFEPGVKEKRSVRWWKWRRKTWSTKCKHVNIWWLCFLPKIVDADLDLLEAFYNVSEMT